MRSTIVVLALLLSAGVVQANPKKAPAKGKAPAKVDVKAIGEKAAGAFQAFCQEWMQKLAVRERDNKAKINWQNGAEGTRGEYVGYSQEHTCQMREYTNPESVPVGIIVYREYRYQQAGATSEEAMQSEPRTVEATEVTEIFRYSAGKWVY
jgi:hypothetical protein